MRRWNRARVVLAGLMCLAGAGASRSGGQPVAGAPLESPILWEMKQFKQMGRVMMIAAHPDDENTQLLTYLARGMECKTAYLSVTRGDGGQNLLGGEFGAELGLIRTEELLSARRLDGAEQFFTRAIDFGYSKTPEETLKVWDHQAVLGDVVRAIRTFRPDVMVTVFSPTAGNTHGHHTASAILGVEAFKIAGDAKAYPEQLTVPGGGLSVWQPKRIVMNVRGGGGGAGGMRMDIGGTDAVLGEGFGDIATRSRAMHKTQGFGQTPAGGARGGGGGPNVQTFALLDGAAGTTGIFDGVDLTWGRFEGGAEIGKLMDGVIAKFDAKDAGASVAGLLEIKKGLDALKGDAVVVEKRKLLDKVIAECLGITVETTVANAEVVPGERVKVNYTARMTANVPVKWSVSSSFLLEIVASREHEIRELKPNEGSTMEEVLTVPAGMPVSQPYWLRMEPGAGIYGVQDATLIGRPENPPAFPVTYLFEVDGQWVEILDEPVQVIAAAGKAQVRRRLDVIAPVSLQFKDEVRLFAPGSNREVEVEVTAHRANAAGVVKLDVPAGWSAGAEGVPYKLAAVGDHVALKFEVTAPKDAAAGAIGAHAEMENQKFSTGWKEIKYEHIPPLLLQPPAVFKAVSLDLAIKGKRVGYLAGAGDSVAEALTQMGYEVTQITGADLTAEKLKGFDAVVVGIRAMNVRTDLAATEQGLFDYAAAGGTVVVQYNQPGGLKAKLGPYNITLSNNLPANRVDEEDAKVTLLVPGHAAFNVPNKIGAGDWDGWVQERGLNFPSDFDAAHFTALLACSDTGEAPLKSGLLVADIGKGHFVYTGLAFFRQLPAGVPGAYRLFANLVSLGK